MAVAPPALAAALRDRYVLEKEVGRGGMATVYLARDVKHDRPVAIKVLRSELSAALGSERFHRDIHLAGKLQHPNILSLYDSGTAEGTLYYVIVGSTVPNAGIDFRYNFGSQQDIFNLGTKGWSPGTT